MSRRPPISTRTDTLAPDTTLCRSAQFEGFGLVHAPGMDSYFQKATIVRLRADGPAQLSVNGKPIAAVPTVFTAPGNRVSGKVAVARSADAKALPQGEVVLVGAADAEPMALYREIGRANV